MVSCKPDINPVKSRMTDPVVTPFLNDTLITSDDGHKGICVAGPFMCAPYGAMVLESLIARGAKKIVVLGWCGAVNALLNIGDIVLVKEALVDEGTSCNYARLSPARPCSTPDMQLTDQLYDFWQAECGNMKLTRQTVWTTDAIYRETPGKVACFNNLGARAVEMECSALFSVARYHKVQISALLVVSDSVASNQWKHGFRDSRFKQARKLAIKTVMRFAKQLD
jgi:purine-nucleoside phosphorylase